MIFNVWDYTAEEPNKELTVRCPGCGQLGTFVGLQGVPDIKLPKQLRWPSVYLGQQRCPNTLCNAHLFFALHRDKLLAVYPAERLDFDRTEVPSPIASTLEESITCYTHSCYKAAAMLVRRTLEELCHDKGVTGSNLKTRLDALGSLALLPALLVNALHDLRLLGNDAAHIESTAYLDLGKEEVELAITVTKSVLHVIYQDLVLIKKLKARQR